jgi:hypothetical protein
MELPQKSTEDANVSGGSPETTGGSPVPPRLPVQVVEHLHRLLGGDPRVERMVEIYIGHRWQAKTLLHLPPSVAREILRRPADFLTAVKKHCEPELKF